MQIIHYLMALAGAYLLGSIPSSVWIGKLIYGLDVREHGSHNAGASNSFRVMGTTAGISVLVIDVLKGCFAVVLTGLIPGISGTQDYQLLREASGLLAATGHIFPVFAGFRGGKGVAVLLGATLVLMPLPVAACLVVFLVVAATSGYVSLGSILAGIALPVAVFMLIRPVDKSLVAYAVLVAILLTVTHRKNISRLFRGEESRLKRQG